MKAQGMPLQFIIIAGILLVTAVIIIFIFRSGAGGIQAGLSSCEQQGGSCSYDTRAACTDAGGRPAAPGFLKCAEKDKVCCLLGGIA